MTLLLFMFIVSIWLYKTRHYDWTMKLPYTYEVLKTWYQNGCQGTKYFLSNTFTLALIAMCLAFPIGYILWIIFQLFTWGKYSYPPTDLAILFWIPIFMFIVFRQRKHLLRLNLSKGGRHGK